MEDTKKIYNGAKNAIDSGGEKPVDEAEQAINDQDKPVYTTEYLRMAARNVMAVRNTRDMAKLALDAEAKDDIPHDENGNIDWSKITFDPGFTPPSFDIKKRLEQLHSWLDPNDPWYQPEYQHTNIRAVIKLYEEGKIDGSQHVYIQDGKIVPKEQTFKVPIPSMVEGIFHQYAQKCTVGPSTRVARHVES